MLTLNIKRRTMHHIKPVALIILDGFGYRAATEYNAIAQAKKPFIDYLFQTYPHTLLQASGEFVGLPPGFAGNSEVGHITIGAGRVIDQPLTIINRAIKSGEFFKNPILNQALHNFQGTLHLIGLLSDAGVHSHIDHLCAFIDAAEQYHISNIVIHAILDGRDTPPKSAARYLDRIQHYLTNHEAIIGSLAGRFYAMDRDHHWDRIEKYYRCLTEKQIVQFDHWQTSLDYYYNHEITDEFIPPTQLTHKGIIKENDGVIFFNFRPDRARQLTESIIDPTFNQFPRAYVKLAFFLTPVDYGVQPDGKVMFAIAPINQTLKEILARHGKKIFSIAETEKYAHVTYFFSGGIESEWPGEERVLIPSLPAKNYIDHPQMSAHQITQTVLKSLESTPRDFYLINYANADMVGHSGDFQATIKAIECLDHELHILFDLIVEKMHGTLYITADHGNAEDKWDEQAQQPRTAHTTNPVPFIMVRQGLEHGHINVPITQLADIAPFILHNMGIKAPEIMTKKK